MEVQRTAAKARPSVVRKSLASAAVLAAAAAVAGLGTFGTFTDSTSVDTTVASGTVSIDLSVPGGPKAIPVTTADFLPGNSLSRPVHLANDGDVVLSAVSLASTATPSSALVSDPVNGLQLTLRSCSKSWTENRHAAAPTYTCGGTERALYAGPVASSQTLSNPASLDPGGTDKLLFTISLPTSAGNELQATTATVSLAFTGVQRTGTAR